MKSKIVAIALVVMMVVGALVFASCKGCDVDCIQEVDSSGTSNTNCKTESCAVVKADGSKSNAKCDC